jgi:hypothetical protein
VRCNENDRHLPVRRGEVALKLETALPRHSHVEHQTSRSVRQLGLGKISNRRKLLDVQADRAQESHDRVAKLGIVVDDHDAGVRFTHPRIMHKGPPSSYWNGLYSTHNPLPTTAPAT